MIVSGLLRVHALALIGGALLVGVGGALHPMLTGDGAAQLTVISATASWRAVHWSLVFGYVLVVAGLMGVLSTHAAAGGAVLAAARTAAFVSTFGYLVSMVGVLFMLGAGTTLAGAYHRGEPGLAGTHAIFVFDMLHPSARAALRVGAFAISLGLVAWGGAVLRGALLPRWLGALGMMAGAAGAIVALVLPEDSPYVVAGVGLATMWQLGAGVLMLLARPAGGR